MYVNQTPTEVEYLPDIKSLEDLQNFDFDEFFAGLGDCTFGFLFSDGFGDLQGFEFGEFPLEDLDIDQLLEELGMTLEELDLSQLENLDLEQLFSDWFGDGTDLGSLFQDQGAPNA